MENENETKEDEYTVPEWWANSYGRSHRSYWD
jgi:hypothetical protein